MIFLAGGHKFYEIVFADGAVHYLEVGDDAAERIEHGVEYKRLERSVGVAFGSGHTLNYGLQYGRYTLAGLAAGADYFLAPASEKVDYLVFDLVGVCALEINLVDNGDNLQVGVDGHIEV